VFTNIIEKKIKSEISKSLVNIKSKKQFTINDVLLSNVSEFTKQFIKVEIINRDDNITTPEIGTLSDTASGLVLNLNSIINTDILNRIIDKSVKLQFNYTIRPKWTLINYIFGKMESAPVDSVRNKLSIFQFYRYYLDTILNYIKDRPVQDNIIITKSRVKNLLEETDTIIHDKLLTNPSSIKVKNFFLQLFRIKYDDISQPKLNDTIPFGFIRIFLEDKTFYGVLDRFMQFCNYLYEDISEKESLYDSKEIQLKDIIKVITGQVKVEEAEMKYITPDINNDYLFLLEDAFEEKKKKTTIKTEQKDKAQSGLEKREITDIFTKTEIEKVQKKIFKNNKLLLYEFFELLKNCKNWDEATEKLKTLFENNDVKLYDEDVVNFVDKLNNYFTES